MHARAGIMATRTMVGTLSLLAGCATAPGDRAPADVGEPTLRERLDGEALSFALEPAVGSALVQVSVRRELGWHTWPLSLDLVDGELALDAAGGLALDRLALRFDDLVIEGVDAAPGGRLHLVDVSLTSAAPAAVAETVWSGGDRRLDATVPIDLVLAWSTRGASGDVVPLGSQRLAGVELHLGALDRDGAEPEVGLSVVRTGELWQWAGMVKLENATLLAQGGVADPVE